MWGGNNEWNVEWKKPQPIYTRNYKKKPLTSGHLLFIGRFNLKKKLKSFFLLKKKDEMNIRLMHLDNGEEKSNIGLMHVDNVHYQNKLPLKNH